MVLRELVTRLSFKVNDAGVSKARRAFAGMNRAANLLIGAGVAAGAALVKMTGTAAKAGDNIAKTSRAMGVSIREYQRYGQAVNYLGIETKQFDTMLRKMQMTVGQAALGEKMYMDTFDNLGVSIHDANGKLKSNEQILKESMRALADIQDPAMRGALAQELFGRAGAKMAGAVSQGADAIDQALDSVDKYHHILTDEEAIASENFIDRQNEMTHVMGGIKSMIAHTLIPVFTDVIVVVRDWFAANGSVIKQGLQEFVAGLVNVFKTAFNIISKVAGVFTGLFGSVESGTLGIQRLVEIVAMAVIAIKAVSIAIAVATKAQMIFNWVLSANPIGIIILAIGALIAIVALVVEYWDEIKAFFIRLWEKIKQVFRDAIEFIKNIFLKYHPLGMIIDNWDAIVDFFAGLWAGVVGIFEDAWAYIQEIIGAIGDAVDFVVGAVESVGGFLFGGSPVEMVNRLQADAGGAAASGAPAADVVSAGVGGNQNLNVNSQIAINVPNGTPEQQQSWIQENTEKAVSMEWQKMMRSMQAGFATSGG